MVNSDLYKLRMIENIEMNSKKKLSNLIYHHNYQTWHFSISCVLPIALLINELEIATNLGIWLTKLIIPPVFGLIVRTAPIACISWCQSFFLDQPAISTSLAPFEIQTWTDYSKENGTPMYRLTIHRSLLWNSSALDTNSLANWG